MKESVPVDNPLRQLCWEAITHTLGQLPSDQRRVFVLSHYYSRSASDIARQLSLPVSEVERLLASANLRLLESLKSFSAPAFSL
ncbi:MAG TPA: sigma factor-like helix-turn-helix DNA-binding protein [Acidobacteriota bacterium]